MNILRHVLLTSAFLTSAAVAQTQLVRGDIDGIQGTLRFRLDCTNIELVSSTVNLQALHDLSRQNDIEFEMQVLDVSVPGQTILDVITADEIPEIFEMGNIRLGRSDTWEVNYTPNSPVGVFLTAESFTSYAPVGPAGTWLLGPLFATMRFGTTNAFGRFQFNFQPPSNPGLVGFDLTGQAMLLDPTGALVITNPDCKTVRPR